MAIAFSTVTIITTARDEEACYGLRIYSFGLWIWGVIGESFNVKVALTLCLSWLFSYYKLSINNIKRLGEL